MANDRVWIELDYPPSDEDGNRRAELLSELLKKLGVPYDQPVFWSKRAKRYCFTRDVAGGFVEAGDSGEWFSLEFLARGI